MVPDVGSLNMPGARSETNARHKGEESEGVRGLKALGVRDLHYRYTININIPCTTITINIPCTTIAINIPSTTGCASSHAPSSPPTGKETNDVSKANVQ